MSIPPAHHVSGGEPLLHPSPYEQGFYGQPVEPQMPNMQSSYPQETISLAAPTPLPPAPRPSDLTIEVSLTESEPTTSGSKLRPTARKNVVPNPKRPTMAGVKLQQKKLSRPFRSPVVHPPVRLAPKPPSTSSEPLVSSANSIHLKEASGTIKSTTAVASSSSQPTDTKIKHRTTRAAAQFKSPLSSAAAASSDEAALVRLTPTIQSLERKLQLLRRALKVREDVEEEALEGLASKWTEAGREAAHEVWDAVKDNPSGEGSSVGDRKGKKRGMEDNWGWDDSGDSKKKKTNEEPEQNWGWDVVPVSEHGGDDDHAGGGGEEVVSDNQQEEEENEETAQPTIGTMLMQLGIAPETLGWDEEEGRFMDNLK
ncbi:hypothetical protein CPC08DRAFT_705846 [Agrocybe pediades]|nr:hypothetical protein CPC08DRAFT_705846 [Agrocybe pediades]